MEHGYNTKQYYAIPNNTKQNQAAHSEKKKFFLLTIDDGQEIQPSTTLLSNDGDTQWSHLGVWANSLTEALVCQSSTYISLHTRLVLTYHDTKRYI